MTDVIDDVQLKLKLAHARLQAEQYAEAEEQCLEVLGQFPEHPDAMMMIGLARSGMGDLDTADKAMVRAINADDSRAEFYLNLGNLRRGLGKTHDAAKLYAMALDRDETSYQARLYLGETLLEMDEPKEALKFLTPLSVSHKDEKRVWRVFGDGLRAFGKPDEALVAYDHALKLDPSYATAHHNKAATLNDLGQPEAAIIALDKAETDGLTHPASHINRAHALMSMGKHDDAAMEYTFALTKDGENCQAHRELANLLWMSGKPKIMTKTIEKARREHPNNHRLTYLHSVLLKEAGEVDQALAVLTDAFPNPSAYPHTIAAMAGLSLEKGAVVDGLNLARKAAQMLPADLTVQDTHIAALFANDMAPEALGLANQIRKLHPLNQRWVAYQATAMRMVGDGQYGQLYDYNRLVKSYTLQPPRGWSSLDVFLADLKAQLDKMHGFDMHPLDQSLRQGSQTTRDLSKSDVPVIKSFFKVIKAPLQDYINALGTDKTHPMSARNTGAVRVHSGWSVRLRPGGFHVNHVHPEGWVSSSFYVDVPDDVNGPDRAGWIQFGEPGVKTKTPLPAEHFVKPEPGLLVLFPSYMWHGTVPFKTGASRLTLPFDAVPA